MAEAIFDLGAWDQEAAWLLLRACLQRAAPALLRRKLLEQRELQAWLLDDPPKSDDKSPETRKAQEVRLLAVAQELKRRRGQRPFYPDTIAFVGERFGLSETERRVLWLAVLHDASAGLRHTLRELDADQSRHGDSAWVIASLVDQPVHEVAYAIGEGGSLGAIGLLQEPGGFYHSLNDYLRVRYAVASALRDGPASEELLHLFLHPALETALCANDFMHLSDDFGFLARYLEAAMQARTRGVNVLLYGDPGTGKTEFARVLAAHLCAPMYEVPEDEREQSEVEDGRSSRLHAYRAAQRLLAATRALIMFDDLEDGILDWDIGMFAKRTSGKAALNKLLESNPVPAIWISNSAQLMEPSHLRRFDYSVAFKAPPRGVRTALVDKRLLRLPISAAFRAELAGERQLTPAQLSTVAKVVGHVAQGPMAMGAAEDAGCLDGLARHVYLATQQLRFESRSGDVACRTSVLRFDLAFINASQSVERIVAMFRNTPGFTACFHGLSGSGKTALAQYIAQCLDKPLLVKCASDLLRPYVGETELRLRGMFEEAMDAGALLLLEEADSFLTDRRRAHRSWEVTQVNELLTQIERYRGHCIATTNAFDMLDPASLRRFDLKVKFGPLRSEQSLGLLEALLTRLGLPDEAVANRNDLRDVLEELPQLTPGDFAVVARRLNPDQQPVTVCTVLDALREEHQLKKPLGRPAGFIH